VPDPKREMEAMVQMLVAVRAVYPSISRDTMFAMGYTIGSDLRLKRAGPHELEAVALAAVLGFLGIKAPESAEEVPPAVIRAVNDLMAKMRQP